MPEVEKTRRNVERLIEQGAPESDIDAYLSAEGYGPGEFAQALRGGSVPGAEPVVPQEAYRGAVLPLRRDASGDIALATPRMAEVVGKALTLPGDVVSGRTMLQAGGTLNPVVIERSFDLGALASPTTAAARSAPLLVRKPVPLSEGRQAAAAAQRLGVELPRAAASDSMLVQQTGKLTSNVPLAGLPMRRASQAAIGQIDDAARAAQRALGTGDRSGAGADIVSGITRTVKEVVPGRVSAKYAAVDSLVDDTVAVPLRATAAKARDIVRRRTAAGIAGEGKAAAEVSVALANNRGLTYSGIKDLRSHIGEMLDNPSAMPSGMRQSELRQVYGALSQDLQSAVRAAGGKPALAAFRRANTAARNAAKQRKQLDTILKLRSDEAVTSRLKAMAGQTGSANIDLLRNAKLAVGKSTWDELGSAILSEMGRATDGTFSPQRFLTAYGKLSDAGKGVLFDKSTRQSLDDIVLVSGRFRQLEQFSNPSGTAQTVMGPGIVAGMIAEPLTTLSTVSTAAALSKILSRPRSAKLVAEWAKASERAAISPGLTTANTLRLRSQPLALAIARESGAAQSAAQILPALQGISKTAADGKSDNGPDPSKVPQRGPDDYDPRVHL